MTMISTTVPSSLHRRRARPHRCRIAVTYLRQGPGTLRNTQSGRVWPLMPQQLRRCAGVPCCNTVQEPEQRENERL